MSLDLLSSNDRFSNLDIFVEQKFPLEDEEFLTRYGVRPNRAAFFDVPWHADMVYFMRREEFPQAATLKGRYPGLILLTFEELPSELTPYIMPVKEDSSSVIYLLEFVEKIMHEREKANLLKSAQQQSAHLFKEAGQYVGELEKSSDKSMDPIIKTFLTLDNELLNERQLNDFISKTCDHFSELNLWDDLYLASLDEIVDKQKSEKGWQIFPLEWLGLPHFLAYRISEEQRKRGSLGLALFLEWLEKYAAFNTHQNVGKENDNLWEEALTQIPIPLALINESGDLLIYNHRFTSLNYSPRECLSLSDEEAVEIQREFYKVRKIEIDKQEGMSYLFLFVNNEQIKSERPNTKDLKSISSQELGIISSSIAHELNNPLAGILAAIGLLELEDWAGEETDALYDMKVSARRCKTLVEIFLGFSRANDKEQRQGTLREALGQALDLLRFRMIESDVRIEVDAEAGSEPFKRYVNLSLGSMVLYLVLSEILTLFNHHRLVLGERELKLLKTSYKEENDRIILSFPKDFELGSKISDSKLIKYLVDVLGLEIDIESNKVILLDWKLI
jgi:signal transduction histidine kinase